VDELTDEMRTTDEFEEHMSRALQERGWAPFEAARFARLPADTQIIGMMLIDQDDEWGAPGDGLPGGGGRAQEKPRRLKGEILQFFQS
jgi:hypothetical protein